MFLFLVHLAKPNDYKKPLGEGRYLACQLQWVCYVLGETYRALTYTQQAFSARHGGKFSLEQVEN